MLSASSEVTLRKNLEGSRTQGLGPPSKSISFEEPRVTKATEEGSTACGGKQQSRRVSGKSRPACQAGDWRVPGRSRPAGRGAGVSPGGADLPGGGLACLKEEQACRAGAHSLVLAPRDAPCPARKDLFGCLSPLLAYGLH